MEITGYDLRENVAVHAMCDYIERELGYYAIQAPSLPVHGHEPPMSMMHAAELAGLGSRSSPRTSSSIPSTASSTTRR